MKKVFSIFAIAIMTIGLFSCEAETNIDETQSLFENIDACDGCSSETDGREDNG